MHDTDLILLPCLHTVNISNAFTLTNQVSIRTPSSHIIGNLTQTNVWRVPDAMFLKSSCYPQMHNIGPVMLRDISGDSIAMSQMLTQDPESHMKAKGTFMGRTINCDNPFFYTKILQKANILVTGVTGELWNHPRPVPGQSVLVVFTVKSLI